MKVVFLLNSLLFVYDLILRLLNNLSFLSLFFCIFRRVEITIKVKINIQGALSQENILLFGLLGSLFGLLDRGFLSERRLAVK